MAQPYLSRAFAVGGLSYHWSVTEAVASVVAQGALLDGERQA